MYFQLLIFQYNFYYSFLLYYCTVIECWIFFKYHQGVKQYGSRSGPTFCRAWSWSKLLAKVISRWRKSPLVGKEFNTKQFLDITFLLKPWLKSISFGSNFFHLAKCWLHQILSQGKPCISLIARKPDFVVCKKERRRPACTSAQSDPRLC